MRISGMVKLKLVFLHAYNLTPAKLIPKIKSRTILKMNRRILKDFNVVTNVWSILYHSTLILAYLCFNVVNLRVKASPRNLVKIQSTCTTIAQKPNVY